GGIPVTAVSSSTPVRRATRRVRRRINWSFVILIVLVCFLLFPIYWMLLTALMPRSAVLSRTPAVIPIGQPMSFDAFTEVFAQTGILHWFVQSGIVTVGAALLSTVISVFAAYAMSRFVIPGRKLVAFTFLM